jgi:broad specificity phosphatase PhoE/8-oxo-dGTP pyrophosphatase MutT (NUDIX family)
VRILLLRHARASAGAGSLDPGLDAAGVAQALGAAGALAGSGARRLLVSPLRRARETAAPIARALGLAPEPCAALGEVFDPGAGPAERLERIGPLLAGRWAEQPGALRAWRRSVLDALLGLEGPGDVVAVSHLVAIGVALGAALGDDRVCPLPVPNASITTFGLAARRLTLLAGPSVSHLDGQPSEPDVARAGIRIDAALVRAALAAERPAPPRLPIPGDAQPSAVVVLLRLGPAPSAFVVARSRRLRDHAGELGFAGGKREAGDRDLRATALRELEEELGVSPRDVAELGTLEPVAVITGRYVIHPFVAALAGGATPRAASAEIDDLIEVPLLPLFTGEQRWFQVRVRAGDASRSVPHFRFGQRVLYGASAVVFWELLDRIAAALGVPLPEPIEEAELPWGDRY